ncbi:MULTISPECIES: CidA/LrgA family protein [Paenibacillus]|jgi:holin-like protein|uniref:Holin n=1 Tax=Paenibacillus borealis TaxID=160799 RepID=A0A089LQF1_PAEBO|nr:MULTISPECIES: CidA/LrgA family protein [Paenibacillus]AIQ32821.1 holin [Paenibacillus sp. FSL P4-0081]AIQ44127.1 holin [Paenibacillus sp. FSL R5-0912]AIQ61393.1 holin [Paenibacillus borealis]KHL93142.1 holin [Paenibacillus sp. IHB B 3415]OMF22634.1 holin [Paenibacillus sp. FSL H8-0259]
MKKIALGLLQVAGLTVFSLLVNTLTSFLHIPLPGSIIGMILLFLLLESGVIRLNWVEVGASWLLAELLLFFIPSAIGVMKYSKLLEADGLQVLAVVLVGTFAVMAGSGVLTGAIYRIKERRSS